MFYGAPDVRIYHPMGDDKGIYSRHRNLHDVRTEGMSYGMMMAVQMDKKEEFDRLWKFAKVYMHIQRPLQGLFAWHCKLDGTAVARSGAGRGRIFAMALFFAGSRWGDGQLQLFRSRPKYSPRLCP
jgi:oligosaccharide reducing-end xylanase